MNVLPAEGEIAFYLDYPTVRVLERSEVGDKNFFVKGNKEAEGLKGRSQTY